MGIPLTVFSLYLLENGTTRCRHHLLVRVEQPGFSNAVAGEYDQAVDVAEAKRRALIRACEAKLADAGCTMPHTAILVGELQAPPPGEELDGRGGCEVDLWVAETRHGQPWVVMGAAPDEAAFWRAVEADGDLARLGAVRPAARLRAWFITEKALETMPGGRE